jgi:hypothetical protein
MPVRGRRSAARAGPEVGTETIGRWPKLSLAKPGGFCNLDPSMSVSVNTISVDVRLGQPERRRPPAAHPVSRGGRVGTGPTRPAVPAIGQRRNRPGRHNAEPVRSSLATTRR